MKLNNYPVALFCYNRCEHLQQTVDALRLNYGAKKTDLFVFSDAAKSATEVDAVKTVRRYLGAIEGFRSVTVIERPVNLGLQTSISRGVSEVCDKYGAAIVLEDDIETSQFFIEYMNDCLNMYKDDNAVMALSGFSYVNRGSTGTYLLNQPMCWGWATWRDRWVEFDMAFRDDFELSNEQIKKFNYGGAFNFYRQYALNKSGVLNTWYIFWYLLIFTSNRLTVYPDQSLCRNLGFDGSGTHSSRHVNYNSDLSNGRIDVKRKPLKPDNDAYDQINDRLRALRLGVLERVKNRLMKFF